MLEAEADQESLWCGVAASEAPEEVGRAPGAAGLEPDLLELAGHFGGRLTVLETGLGVGGEDVRSDHPRPELSVVTSRPVTLRDQNKPRFFFTFIPNLPLTFTFFLLSLCNAPRSLDRRAALRLVLMHNQQPTYLSQWKKW